LFSPQEKVPKLEPIRIPMNQEKAPAEENFDQIGRVKSFDFIGLKG
jgi:hypothetical protein